MTERSSTHCCVCSNYTHISCVWLKGGDGNAGASGEVLGGDQRVCLGDIDSVSNNDPTLFIFSWRIPVDDNGGWRRDISSDRLWISTGYCGSTGSHVNVRLSRMIAMFVHTTLRHGDHHW